MAKDFCSRYAQVEVNGKNVDSKLHKALLDKIKIRPIANLVYAMYWQGSNPTNGIEGPVVQAMNVAGYTLNTQGQHNISAVLEFLGFQNIVTDIAEGTVRNVEISNGIREASTDRLISFSDPLVALKKAQTINNLKNAKGESIHMSANVLKHGSEYQVVVRPVSSHNLFNARNVENRLFIWDKLKEAMTFKGVNMDSLRLQFADMLSLEVSNINYLENIMRTDNKYLTKRECEFLLASNNSADAQNLIKVFGDISNTAQVIYDNYHVSKNAGYAGLIDKVMKQSKELYSVLDANFNANTIDILDTRDVNTSLSESTQIDNVEEDLKEELKRLNQKYHIDFNEIRLRDKHIKTLSEATAKAIAILERRINDLENQSNTLQERKKLTKLRNTLMRELEGKQYYMGMLNYLTEANDLIIGLEDTLNNLPSNGTDFENALALAKILKSQGKYIKGYTNLFRDLLEDLAHIEKIAIDENIAQAEIDNIKSMANKALISLEAVKNRGENKEQDCMVDIVSHIFGDKLSKEEVIDLVMTCKSDASLMDVLYSFGKLSDNLCAAIGDMVRTAQDDRNEAITAITVRIRNATDRLYRSKSTSEFMYESDGHIISDYDWAAYKKAYNKQKAALISQGIKGFDLEEALEQWEELNTEDYIADKNKNRTERVPSLSLYRKKGPSFRDSLTSAQLEYYDTMMKIKGEMGSLLPEWAQTQFMPPQIRRDFLTAIKEESSKNVSTSACIKSVLETTGDKISEFWKVKEDDTDWGINGYKSSAYAFARGDLAGVETKNIPIFFVNKLSNQDELFKNFSAGLNALAATAENYAKMSEIVDVAEFMRDYIKEKNQQLTKKNVPAVETVSGKTTRIITDVTTAAINPSLVILDHMFDKHFYNEHIKGNPFWAKMIGNITAYTSFKGLSTNYVGATANLLVGEQQLFQMAFANTMLKAFRKGSSRYFGLTDWALGVTKLLGAPLQAVYSAATGKNQPSVILDLVTNNKQSKDYLMAEYFDLFNENYSTMMHTRYYKGARQLLHDISYIMYGAGEKAIRYNALWAMLNNKKVSIGSPNGSLTSLQDIFVLKGDKTSPHLELVPDIYYQGKQITDANGELTSDGKEFLRIFKKDLRYCCQGMFGAMNEEDKGIVHMYAWGKAAMNFRQWMVGHYSERLRGIHWDYDKHEFVRGYYVSTGRFIQRALTTEEARDLYEDGQKFKFWIQFTKDLKNFRKNWLKEWSTASDTEKLDLMRVMSAITSYTMLWALTCLVGGGLLPKFGGIIPAGNKEEEKARRKTMDPETKFAYYQLRRLVFEADSSTPLGAIINYKGLLKSPIPAINTFNGVFYAIQGLDDMGTPIKTGPDAGMDKYWRNIMKYNLPFYRDLKRFQDWEENQNVFDMFNDNNLIN